MLRYHGRRQELSGLVRSLISDVVDLRDSIQIAYDELAQRAEAMLVSQSAPAGRIREMAASREGFVTPRVGYQNR